MPKRPTSHPAGAPAFPTTVTTDIEVRAAKGLPMINTLSFGVG